jgi:hypothetical protein
MNVWRRVETGRALTVDLDVELEVFGVPSDAWVAAWDVLSKDLVSYNSFLSCPLRSNPRLPFFVQSSSFLPFSLSILSPPSRPGRQRIHSKLT